MRENIGVLRHFGWGIDVLQTEMCKQLVILKLILVERLLLNGRHILQGTHVVEHVQPLILVHGQN